MSDYDLKVTVESDPIRIGASPQPPNKLTIRIENLGGDIEQILPARALCIQGRLGPEPDALFLNSLDFAKCSRALDGSADWQAEPKTSSDGGSFSMELNRYSDVFLEQDEAVTLTLTDVLSCTAAGAAALAVTLGPAGGEPLWKQENIRIEKEKDFTGINYFYSKPSELAEHLPGTSVTLHWLTSKLGNLKLLRNDVEVPCDFTKAPGSKEQAVGTGGRVNFTLVAHDAGLNWDHKSTLTLNVVTRGWNDVELVLQPGDPGYPSAAEATAGLVRPQGGITLTPAMIALAPDNRLYGLFRRGAAASEGYLLFSTDNPRGVWSLVDEQVPSAFATSPGVIAAGKLWLVGGSRIRQEQTSNRLCCYDLEQGTWRNEIDAGRDMPARMGHGVVYFKDRVWVMGGRDAGGNARDDVWTFDPKAEAPVWHRETEHAKWPARCLISPVVYDGQIWLFGGAEEPDSDKLFADIWCGDGKNWISRGTPGFLKDAKLTPLGGALQVMHERLVLIGRGRRIEGADERTEQFFQQLDSATSSTWRSLKADALAEWGPYVTFACTLVGWTRSHATGSGASHLLLALALGPDDSPNYANTKPLKFYLA